MKEYMVRGALKRYRDYFSDKGIAKERYDYGKFPQTDREILEHCHYLLDKVDECLKKDDLSRAAQHLGFVQGCFWSLTLHTYLELKSHTAPVSDMGF